MDRELTLGGRYVGLTFNPSGDEKVLVVKKAYASIIDMLNSLSDPADDAMSERDRFTELAIGQAVSAQMMAVKAITWKD